MNVLLKAQLAAFTMISLSLAACSDSSTDPTPEEFVADSADFAGYSSWEQTTEPRVGVDPAGILAGGAHGATDSMMTRSMFISPSGAKRGSSGQFPVGTMLLKDIKDPAGTVMMITAMAKRGASFDPAGKDWEYLLLDAKGSITGRGAGLMDGMCKACHSAAATTDYVFTR
jgi:hypothetical protein